MRSCNWIYSIYSGPETEEELKQIRAKYSSEERSEMLRGCTYSDEYSLSYSRKFPKFVGRNLEPHMAWLNSKMESYKYSCQLKMDIGDGLFSELTFTTRREKTRKIGYTEHARNMLQVLQLNMPPTAAFRLISGIPSTYHVFPIAYQKDGICTKFGIDKEQFAVRKELLRECLQELQYVTNCDIQLAKKFVVFVGFLRGVDLVKDIVTDCIGREVHPSSRIESLKNELAKEGYTRLEPLTCNVYPEERLRQLRITRPIRPFACQG